MNRRSFIGLLAASGLDLALRTDRLWAEAARSIPFGSTGVRTAAAAPILGINSHTYHWREPEVVEQVRDLGMRHVRITGILQFWEGEVPSYRAYMRETAELAAKNGVRLLWVLHNARGKIFHTGVDRRWWERMTNFAVWTAGLPATDGVQLWNEQDMWVQAPFGSGASPRASAESVGRSYADFLRMAYPRIKKAHPRVRVVSGGTADHPDARWRGFLAGMMESRPPVDAVGFHAYGRWERVGRMLGEAEAVVDGQAPLWLTECGMDTPERFSEARQLQTWRTVIEGNQAEPLAARVYPYCLQTDPRAPGHGLFAPDGSPRSTYRWLRSRAAG